jgi:hypothetical protein
MLPLALGLCLDFYVVGRLVFDSRWPALGAALLLGVVAFFWLLFPSSQRLQELLDRLPPSGGPADPPE